MWNACEWCCRVELLLCLYYRRRRFLQHPLLIRKPFPLYPLFLPPFSTSHATLCNALQRQTAALSEKYNSLANAGTGCLRFSCRRLAWTGPLSEHSHMRGREGGRVPGSERNGPRTTPPDSPRPAHPPPVEPPAPRGLHLVRCTHKHVRITTSTPLRELLLRLARIRRLKHERFNMNKSLTYTSRQQRSPCLGTGRATASHLHDTRRKQKRSVCNHRQMVRFLQRVETENQPLPPLPLSLTLLPPSRAFAFSSPFPHSLYPNSSQISLPLPLSRSPFPPPCLAFSLKPPLSLP